MWTTKAQQATFKARMHKCGHRVKAEKTLLESSWRLWDAMLIPCPSAAFFIAMIVFPIKLINKSNKVNIITVELIDRRNLRSTVTNDNR